MSNYLEQLIDSLNDLFRQEQQQKQAKKDEEHAPHDLGHASKCVWELDKEA